MNRIFSNIPTFFMSSISYDFLLTFVHSDGKFTSFWTQNLIKFFKESIQDPLNNLAFSILET